MGHTIHIGMRYSPSNKILVVLPFWSGDRSQMFKLARLIADLEPQHSTQADILFVARFDCKHGEQTVRHVSRKFNVLRYTSPKRGVGWPLGCNEIFAASMEYCFHKMKAGQIPGYKAVFNMAADTAPLAKNWIGSLSAAWDGAPAVMTAGALIAGSVHGREHINGDACVLSGNLDFLQWVMRATGNLRVAAGWDWVLAMEFEKRGWKNIPCVRSLWRHHLGFTKDEWNLHVSQGTKILHGVKDDSVLELTRKNLLI